VLWICAGDIWDVRDRGCRIERGMVGSGVEATSGGDEVAVMEEALEHFASGFVATAGEGSYGLGRERGGGIMERVEQMLALEGGQRGGVGNGVVADGMEGGNAGWREDKIETEGG